jgi:uncharacterized membrane protein
VKELVIVGFTDHLRAVEVLPQLQRLKFNWSSDLRTAIAVQVERDGRLRLHHSQLLDPAHGLDETFRWKAILNAIVPLPHVPPESAPETASQVRKINAEGSNWLRGKSFNDNFIRDASAVLRPGNSAIFAIVHETDSALPVLAGYSPIVLHASFARFVSETGLPPWK